MNIFYLDSDIQKCAQAHCDKHVVKMILEYAQLLFTTARNGGIDKGYKITHINHPCAKWVRDSEHNFLYLVDLQSRLNDEYKLRYSGKDHKSYLLVSNELEMPVLPRKPFYEPPKCVPDDLKHLDTISAYRAYYRGEKAYFCTWKANKPEWFEN